MKKEKKVEPSSVSPAIAKQVLAAVPSDNKNKSCSKPCSPSDWYKGGKCDKNGCYYE